MKKKAAKAYHHGDLKQALVKACLAWVEKKGTESLSLRALAQQIGVSHAATYRHFQDKNDVLQALAEEGFRIFHEYLEKALQIKNKTAEQRFIEQGLQYIRFAKAHREHFQLMWSADIQRNKSEGVKREAERSFQALLTATEEWKAEQAVRCDSMEIALQAWIQVHGTATLILSNQFQDDPLDDQFVRRNIERMLSSFAKGKSPARRCSL
jgi:AcrR family transcriptional regulator